jgi:regulator of nucleoside diphosphate kinase
MTVNSRIVLSRPDALRLRAILGAHRDSIRDREHLLDLQAELERAWVLDEDRIAEDLVTIDAKVRVRDKTTGKVSDYVLVAPAQANVATGHISVLAPLGTALLGYREGDEVEWSMPGGVRSLRIEKVRQSARRMSHREELAVS